jgi:hypothetical protein
LISHALSHFGSGRQMALSKIYFPLSLQPVFQSCNSPELVEYLKVSRLLPLAAETTHYCVYTVFVSVCLTRFRSISTLPLCSHLLATSNRSSAATIRNLPPRPNFAAKPSIKNIADKGQLFIRSYDIQILILYLKGLHSPIGCPTPYHRRAHSRR